jgi:uncharacterized Tic20 family protein
MGVPGTLGMGRPTMGSQGTRAVPANGAAAMNGHVNEKGRYVIEDSSPDDRSYATLLHLSLLAHMVLPYISIIIPLVMWNTKKKESDYIDDHGREAMNFQISLLIYSFLLPIIAIPIGLLLLGVGILVTVPLAALFPYVLGLVGLIMAAMAANRGEMYRYPMTIRFLHD